MEESRGDGFHVLAGGSHKRRVEVPPTTIGAPILLFYSSSSYPHTREHYMRFIRGMRIESSVQRELRFGGGPLCIYHKATKPQEILLFC